jgi:Phosphomannomutase
MPLFGTNGIRGVLNETITPELGYRFGMAVGTYYSDSDVALSYDNRTTSHLLKDAVESGLLNTGKNVVDLGMIPTPTRKFIVNIIMSLGPLSLPLITRLNLMVSKSSQRTALIREKTL